MSLKLLQITHKQILIPILLIGLFTMSACVKQPDGMSASGKTIYLADYQGKWVIINYWAKWCKPCLTELPELNKVYDQHSKTTMVLGVSFDDLPKNEIKQFKKKLALNFPLLVRFNQKSIGIDEISSLPITYVISPKGKLVKTLRGPQTLQSIEQAISNNN